MLGPSGFFMANGPEDSPISSTDLELAHSSQSGFNVLYRGCKNGRFFIYKGLKPEYIGNPIYEDLLKKDFDIGFSLSHNGICQYFAMINHPQKGNCIVMEWIDGSTLEELIVRKSIDKPLARKIICEICDALEYMHGKQVIHRDLKPENILITHNGKNVKIIDFGLSDTDSYNRFKGPAGTRIYASPELKAGEQADGRSDLWSLGMIINEMTGKYRHVAGKCLRRNKDKRYRSAQEVKKAIMKAGTREAAIWLSAILIVAAISTVTMVYLDATSEDMEVPVEQVIETPVVQKEDTVKVIDVPAVPVRKPDKPVTEHMDEASLEDMFNEAASLLL